MSTPTTRAPKGNRDMIDFRRVSLALIVGGALLSTGCAFQANRDSAYFDRQSGRDAVESQLAGEALSQRKYSMRRVRRDLASFRLTLEQLQRHGKATGITRFERFARPYLEERVDPLVQHPPCGFVLTDQIEGRGAREPALGGIDERRSEPQL